MNNHWNLDITAERESITKNVIGIYIQKPDICSICKIGKIGLKNYDRPISCPGKFQLFWGKLNHVCEFKFKFELKMAGPLIIPFNINAIIISVVEIFL